MANNLSTTKMTNPIRGLVSKRRRRYTQDGFDLDLTYINDRIIAMGYPAEMLESIYRNKIEDVQRMLDKNHPGRYKIYNLCSERSYNHERFPYYSVYPFKDHNPPDIELINSFCKDVDEHLQADSRNVVAVHCKAGKGRTGTMICCYLLYSRKFSTAAEALHYYGQRRTRDSKGVTIPSQRRYVEYYATLLRSNESYRPVTLYICEIRLSPAVNVKEGTLSVTGKSPQPLPEFKRIDDQTVAKLDYCMPLAGDVKIEFVKSLVLRKEKKCHFWFNTYFVEKSAKSDAEGNLFLTLSKSEIDDAHKDKDHKEYPNNFTVTMVLRRVPQGKYSESVSLKKCHSPTAVTTSPLIKSNLDNNRQQQIPHQLQQQIQQIFQHGQHPPAAHKPLSSDPNWPSIFKKQLSYNDGNNDSFPSVGFLNDQHNDHHNQRPPNLIPPQQNNHHSKQPILTQQQQQQQQQQPPQQQQPLAFQSMHADSHQQPQYLDENLHCLEFSETSSSESSTEEEGWDSGSAIDSIRHHHSIATTTTTTTTHNNNVSTDNNNGHKQLVVVAHLQQQPCHHLHNPYDDGPSRPSSVVAAVASEPLKSPANAKSPIKKSASAVEAVVTSAAHKLNSKLRRMSTNAILSFSAHNSNNTNCKSNNKPSTSSSVSVSSNKCDIFNPLSRPSAQQQPNGKGSNPASPLTSPTKPVVRSISNDPTAAGTTDGTPMNNSSGEARRDSLPIIGGLLSSFSSSSVSSSNSSSLSSSNFGMINLTHGPTPIPKTNKLKILFSVSSCYGNGLSGRDPDDDDNDNDDDDDTNHHRDGRKRDSDGCGDGGDDHAHNNDNDQNNEHDHDDNVVDDGDGAERRKVGVCASNSDSGRSSTEIVPEATEDRTNTGSLQDLV
ncbi:transcription factor mef2A isoform X2 [Topomyia yanbarensis]|uniref:transcription factor mef2A isoform X2 n=1 Tax=Topomyia yanbarensis TaxID=2498891 RepID=UPI00273ACB2B|nr:transcription factor mef2A isoform X2 [Topomyia yanbarensis]